MRYWRSREDPRLVFASNEMQRDDADEISQEFYEAAPPVVSPPPANTPEMRIEAAIASGLPSILRKLRDNSQLTWATSLKAEIDKLIDAEAQKG